MVHLKAQFKSNYQSIDYNGLISDDNSNIKIITIKFPMDYLQKHKLNSTLAKKFFDEYFVGKRFVTFPILEEMPVFETKNGVRNLVKDQTQASIDENFNLSEFITLVKKEIKN